MQSHLSSLNFWEISDNISEMVQDRGIVAVEDEWEILCGLSVIQPLLTAAKV